MSFPLGLTASTYALSKVLQALWISDVFPDFFLSLLTHKNSPLSVFLDLLPDLQIQHCIFLYIYSNSIKYQAPHTVLWVSEHRFFFLHAFYGITKTKHLLWGPMQFSAVSHVRLLSYLFFSAF